MLMHQLVLVLLFCRQPYFYLLRFISLLLAKNYATKIILVTIAKKPFLEILFYSYKKQRNDIFKPFYAVIINLIVIHHPNIYYYQHNYQNVKTDLGILIELSQLVRFAVFLE